jgi:hypothetical protein
MSAKRIAKTIRRSAKGTKRKSSKTLNHTQQLSRTMAIALEPVVNDVCLKRACMLEISGPNMEENRLHLKAQSYTIGRDAEAEISLPLSNVSREHARIVGNGEEYRIEDLESTNGTYVNGVRVSRCILRNNDHIRVGDARLVYTQQRLKKKT